MPEAALRNGGPKSCNKCRKVWKYEGPGLHFGALWDSAGAPWEDIDDLGDGFGFNLGSAGSVFTILLEKSDLCISTPLSSGIAIMAGPGPKLEPLGQKSRTRSVQNGLEVANWRDRDSQVWQVRSVLL